MHGHRSMGKCANANTNTNTSSAWSGLRRVVLVDNKLGKATKDTLTGARVAGDLS